MFIHFGPATWRDPAQPDRRTPLTEINPDIDTDQWVSVARDLGARYVVMVAKHEDGFCLWPTQTTDYGILNTPWKLGRGDVMADLAASCRRAGLGLGVYLSPRDDNFGAATGGKCDTPGKQGIYNIFYRQQLTELLTRYGEMAEVWFDGSVVIPVGDVLAAYAPHAMIFQGPQATIRWVGNEDGFAPYPAWDTLPGSAAATGTATARQGDPDGDAWLPLEVDVSIRRPHWFWSPDDERSLLSLRRPPGDLLPVGGPRRAAAAQRAAGPHRPHSRGRRGAREGVGRRGAAPLRTERGRDARRGAERRAGPALTREGGSRRHRGGSGRRGARARLPAGGAKPGPVGTARRRYVDRPQAHPARASRRA